MTVSEASVDFIAGWCSGAVSVLVCQPIDTVLTRFQAGSALLPSESPAPASAANGPPSSVHAQARSFVRSDGLRALWRGSSAMIGAVPLQNALLMGGYGIGKQYSADVLRDTPSPSPHNNQPAGPSLSAHNTHLLASVFVGGCVGGVLQSFLMSPVELVKVHQQVVGQSAKNATLQLVHGFWHSPRNSWKGLTATLLRDGIPHGVWFATYDYSKTVLSHHWKDTAGEQVTVPLVSGAVAATVAWAVGYPFDLIKTRIQATASTATANATPKGILATAQDLVAEANGRVFAGLYRGFGLKLVRSIPASMVGFVSYEFVAEHLRS